MEEQKPGPEQAATEPDFTSVYANNCRLELSVWDLKIFFGQLEQHTGKTTVDWHTAVTIPWMQAKLLEYYLRINRAFQEKHNGPIQIHPSVMPQLPAPPTEEEIKTDPGAMEMYETFKKIHINMFGG